MRQISRNRPLSTPPSNIAYTAMFAVENTLELIAFRTKIEIDETSSVRCVGSLGDDCLLPLTAFLLEIEAEAVAKPNQLAYRVYSPHCTFKT